MYSIDDLHRMKEGNSEKKEQPLPLLMGTTKLIMEAGKVENHLLSPD